VGKPSDEGFIIFLKIRRSDRLSTDLSTFNLLINIIFLFKPYEFWQNATRHNGQFNFDNNL